jgi:hypothetical protein
LARLVGAGAGRSGPRLDLPEPACVSALSGVGLLVIAYGVWVLDPWATVAGVILGSLAKLWFCDRMVWLYEDMQAAVGEDPMDKT